MAAGCARHHGRSAAAPAVSATAGADARRGSAVYRTQCAACHGADGAGGPVGPSLRNEGARRSYDSVYALIRDPAPPMPKLYPSRLSAADLRDVAAYVESL